MTVLPQLEQELLGAQSRRARRRRRPVLGSLGTAAAVVCAIGVALLAVTLAGHRHNPPAPMQPQSPRVLVAHVGSARALAAGNALYVANQMHPTTRPVTRLMVVDPRTGDSLSRVLFGRASVDDLLISGGSLWITTAGHGRAALWRLDPASLRVISHRPLPSPPWPGGSLASAGGWLWLGLPGGLERISLRTGAVTATIPIDHAPQIQVGSDPGGRTLLVSRGNGGGRGYVERRDPSTGALLATSKRFDGVTEPSIGGIVDGGVWLSEPTGMMGYIERVDAATLRPTPPREPVGEATNGIRAQVFDGILWVTQSGVGGARFNYCADPATGRRRAPLPRAVQRADYFVTADANNIYYVTGRRTQTLMAAPIDPRCR
jgi:hypothetical protein